MKHYTFSMVSNVQTLREVIKWLKQYLRVISPSVSTASVSDNSIDSSETGRSGSGQPWSIFVHSHQVSASKPPKSNVTQWQENKPRLRIVILNSLLTVPATNHRRALDRYRPTFWDDIIKQYIQFKNICLN